jgi:Raf kinase inhibitor-like YbhB/YbcL family protein
MKLESRAFDDNQPIPVQYTCDGENISPPLSWGHVPGNAKSLALIVEDPDAPKANFTHWVIWNMWPVSTSLPDGSAPARPALEGTNDMGKRGYGGPCPPSGAHHYVFTLYALDAPLSLDAGSSKEALRQAMQGHVLEQAVLTGIYQRPGH